MSFSFLWKRAKEFGRELTLISMLTILGSLAALAVPWLAGQMLGGMFSAEPASLYELAGLLAVTLVLLAAFNITAEIISAATSGRILAKLREDAYARIQSMPMSFHDRSSKGDLLALMTYEVAHLSGFLTNTLANLPSMLLTAAGAVILLFLIDPAIALFVPLLVPVFFILAKLIGRRLRMIARKTQQTQARLVAMAESDLEMLPAVKSFATEDHHRKRYAATVEEARLLSLAEDRITAFIAPIVGLIAAGAAILIILVSGSQLASGESTPGDVFAFLLYAALLTRPVGGLAEIYGHFQLARGTLARLDAVFAQPIEPGYSAEVKLDRASGSIEFRQVSFAYPERMRVLDGVDLSVEAGEIVALTGDNGIGKSTLIRLLLRFYDPDSGQIMLDGRDIGEVQVQSLREQIGYVPQRALLFNGTVRDNIAFGVTSPDVQRIEHAARLSQAWEFIRELPEGLDTEIGDNGVRLSGGQRQRIALARALYRDPPIYILDEATSMYDLDSEAAFVEDCIEALAGRTVILVTHRPASLALATRVLQVSGTGIAPVS
ncbi:MAG: ABC transporter ATP-binding protein [Pseudomonadota bacterium]